MQLHYFIVLCFLAGIISACSSSNCEESNSYIHLSHIRQMDTVDQKVDPRVEMLDLTAYDMVLLGGDLTEEASKEEATVGYLSNIFDLKSPNTLWAWGNHDNANPQYIHNATGRKDHFTYHKAGITWVVLNSQERSDWECYISGDQFKMLEQVVDTIAASSHLVVMTHKLLWLADDPEMEEHQGVNNYDWASNYRVYSHGWYKKVKPLLEKVQAKNVQVVCLAGDIGNHTREFEERSSSGIYYLASGISATKQDSKVLIFKHTPCAGQLSWNFHKINNL